MIGIPGKAGEAHFRPERGIWKMHVHYFAYGSCMDETDFRRTVPEFHICGRALLPDYRLVFSKFGSGRQGGVADIIPAKGDQVQGVLYLFDEIFLPELDLREGVAEGMYERIEIDVLIRGCRQRAYTYQIIDKEAKEVKPSAAYARLIWNGMSRFATPDYQQRFQTRLKQDFGLCLPSSAENDRRRH